MGDVRLTRGVQQQRQRAKAGSVRALLGRKLGHARWGAAAMVLAGLASLCRAAGCEAHFFFSFFLFSVLFHLFEFKSGFGF